MMMMMMMMNTMGIRSMLTVTANITRRIIQENTTTTTTTTTAAAKERVEGLVLARGWLQRRHAAATATATATARNAGDAKEDGGGTNTQSAVGISEARKESRLRSLEEHSSVFDSFRQTKQVIDLQGKTVVGRVIGFHGGSGSRPLAAAETPDGGEGASADLVYPANSKVLIDLGLGKEVVVRTNEALQQIHADERSGVFSASESGGSTPSQQQQQQDARHPVIGRKLRLFVENVSGFDGEMLCSTLMIATRAGDSGVRRGVDGAASRRDDVFREIVRRFKGGEIVPGRVLNACNGGYSVGIGGHVAFAPMSGCPPWVARKIGVLQPFYIKSVEKVDKRESNILVVSAERSYGVSGGGRSKKHQYQQRSHSR